MIDQRQVTACLVTRGNIDMQPILDSLIFDHVIVWNNAERPDMRTFGRYQAADEATTDIVYFQDDDTIVSLDAQYALLERWEPGAYLCNMEDTRNRSEYAELCWPGWGSICERSSYRDAFERWGGSRDDYWFQIVGCDIVHGMLTGTDVRRVDLGVRHLNYAHATDRAYQLPGFRDAKQAFYEACQSMRVPC